MPRSYSSPVRAEQAARTRRAVITAARELFLSAGWNATTMAGVAEHARVARQTVYDLFGGKLTLLDAVIDVDLAGDDAPVAAADRARFAAMGQGTRAERLARAARWLAETQIRAVPLEQVLERAADSEPEAAARVIERERERWDTFRSGLRLILGAEPDPELVDIVWALGSRQMWIKLVVERGWSTDQWQSWLATAVGAALPH